MKGLDTPVLLDILEGKPGARKLVDSLRGQEVCTTEANVVELMVAAQALGSAGLWAKMTAIDRLRRGLTVLPLDAKAAAASVLRRPKPAKLETLPTIVAMMLGAMESRGCTEWITSRTDGLPKAWGKVRIVKYPR